MHRSDLLALTNDDLTVLSNRGLVKRATKELEKRILTYELTENESQITIAWSDDVECILPSREQISDRHCSCSATNICRHLIRSILLYQREYQESKGENLLVAEPNLENEDKSAKAQIASKIWNPGDINDAELAAFYSKATITRSRKEFNSGQVIEVIRASKPIARLHTLAYTVRFLVPGDLRYTYCDCNETAPCRHVLFAVWAFRLLEENKISGIIDTVTEVLSTPTELLNEIDRTLQDLLKVGIKDISTPLIGRLERLANQCRQVELIWLGEIIAELIQMCDRYTNRDARFSISKVVELIGELCIRSDAIRSDGIRNNIETVPQLFIRGSKADKLTDIGAARLIGLGCGVEVKKQSTVLTTYLQDTDSGTVVAVCHEFIDPEVAKLPTFSQLAQKAIFKRVSLASLGAGQMLVKGGKRSPNYQFIPGRSQIVINPQSFQWSQLRSPLLVEDFEVLKAHLELLPPAALRPRRLTESFHVLAIDRVESVEFSNAEQETTAILKDANNSSVILKFPYNSRAAAGTELLLSWLNNQQIKFVAGQVYNTTSEMAITPVSLVRQEDGTNYILQPWIAGSEETSSRQVNQFSAVNFDPLQEYLQQLERVLSDFWLLGIARIDAKTIADWEKLGQLGRKLGLVYMTDKCDRVLEELHAESQRRREEESWEMNNGFIAGIILELTVLTQISN
ncbi:MAG: hypothetical protein AAF383_14480 [Cyanobacteria bacterium P01_A01_bin.83]